MNSIEDAISIIEESAAAQSRATETGDYKVGNMYLDKEMKALTCSHGDSPRVSKKRQI